MSPRTARAPRAAITLVELLVVIAILGILMALLLPAVQGVRESARLTACRSKIRQLGVGIQQFEHTNGCFPSAQWWEAGGAVSGLVQLLPFIEQKNIYDALTTTVQQHNDGNLEWYTSDVSAANVMLPAYLCPSVRTPGPKDPRTCYVFCSGDHPTSDNSWMGNRGLVIVDNERIMTTPRAATYVYRTRARRAAHCKDGLSNTIFMAERVYGDAGERQLLKIGNSLTPFEWQKPVLCAAKAAGATYVVDTTASADAGRVWHAKQPANVTFATVFPPNGPSCGIGAGPWWGSATSLHAAGGVNVLFGDGSTRFISELIDATSRPSGSDDPTNLPPVRRGPSPFGVWGALGSFSGNGMGTEAWYGE